MKNALIGSLVFLLTSSGLCLAQEFIPESEHHPVPASVIAASCGDLVVSDCWEPTPCEPRVWGGAEYLLWWIKDSPAPVPLVSTNVLSEPGAAVLLGGNSVNNDLRHGGRFTLGGWINQDQTLGLEGSYFFLASRAINQSVASSGLADSQLLAIPFLDAISGTESATGLALPNSFAGIGTMTISSRLQGAELNAITPIGNRSNLRVTGMLGARWLQLDEALVFTTSSPFINVPNNVFQTFDQFDARTNFYGGQLGARFEYNINRFFVAATTKVALGVAHQSVRVNGGLLTNDFNGFGPPEFFLGGYFAQPSNIGTQRRDRFAVLPEVNLTLGYDLTERVRFTVGYTFLYLSNVVRPGDQVDRVINPTNAPAFVGAAAFTNPPAGPARPMNVANSSDFWAHGANFGVELRY